MKKPKRIQLSRRRGFRLQQFSQQLNGLPAVKIDRTTPYGNPYPVGIIGLGGVVITLEESLRVYEHEYLPVILAMDPDFLEPLRGNNVACWCGLDEECHEDILLRLANRATKRTPHPSPLPIARQCGEGEIKLGRWRGGAALPRRGRRGKGNE